MLKGLPLYNLTITDQTDGVYRISLVDMPAIESDFLLFNEDEKKRFTFSNDEKHIVTGAVMIPDMPIYRCDETGFEYYVQFSKETIEKSAQLFFKNGYQANISIGHEYDVNNIYVFESYIVNKERGIAPSDIELPDGTWVVSMKCDNDELWDALKNSDMLHGFSIETFNTAERLCAHAKKVVSKSWLDELLEGKI